MFKVSFAQNMKIDDVKNLVNSNVYKNEFEKEKTLNDAILKFKETDKDGDGILSESEINSYKTKENLKTAAKIGAVVIGAALAGFAIYKGCKFFKNKAILSNVSESSNVSEGVKVLKKRVVTAESLEASASINNEVLNKAAELGLAPAEAAGTHSLISNASRNNWLKPGQTVNPDKLGVFMSDGTLKFQSEEKAIEYGKKQIMEALNSANPHEVNVDIAKNGRVLFKNGGDIGSVYPMSFDNKLRSQIHTTMHGHPDFLPSQLGKGYTTAISTNDIEVMTMNPSTRKMIVFNSKGEYYQLVKQKGFKLSFRDLMNIFGDFPKDYANTRAAGHLDEIIVEGCTRGKVLEEAYYLDSMAKRLNKLGDIAEETGREENLGKIRQLIKRISYKSYERVCIGSKPARFRYNIACDLEERARRLFVLATEDLYDEKLLEEASTCKEIIQKSHRFWQEFAEKYGLKMSTNFSNFV